jgi:hypothetical protein
MYMLSTQQDVCQGWYSDWLWPGRQEGARLESRYPQEFSFSHVIQTSSVACPASSLISTGTFIMVVKWLQHEADHSLLTTVKVKKTWIYTSTPPYAAGCNASLILPFT